MIVLISLAFAAAVRAEGPDDQYLSIYGIIEQADSLSRSGRVDNAKAKYREAQGALLNLKRDYPAWNAKVVSYRLNYIAGRMADLARPAPEPAGAALATNPPGANAQAASTKLPAGMQFKLLDAGAEPRQVLRLRPKPGDKQTLDMTVKTAMDMGLAGAPGQAMKLPAIQITLEMTVKSISAEGDIAFETVIGDASVGDEPGAIPQIAEAMKATIGGLKGLHSTGRMSDRGVIQGTEMDIPAGTAPPMRQSVEQMKEALGNMSSELPAEAVGPGAKWEVTQPIKSQGMAIHQTTTCELVSLEGDQLKTRSAIVQHATNQKIPNPAMPGMNVEVTKMTGSGTAEATLDLTKLMPSHATVKSHAELSMGMNVGGQKQTLSMKTDTEVLLESK